MKKKLKMYDYQKPSRFWKVNKKLAVQAIAFAALMLSLTLVFSYIASFSAFPFAPFLKIDISLIFLVATLIIAGYRLAFLNLILKLVISPAFTSGYSALTFIGHIILFINFLLIVTIYTLLVQIHNLKSRKENLFLNLKVIYHALYLFSAFVVTTLVISTLNTFVFNAIYFYLFGTLNHATYNALVLEYGRQNLKFLFFGLDNYIAGSYALYLSFNSLQFAIDFLLLVPFLLFLARNKKIFIFHQSW